MPLKKSYRVYDIKSIASLTNTITHVTQKRRGLRVREDRLKIRGSEPPRNGHGSLSIVARWSIRVDSGHAPGGVVARPTPILRAPPFSEKRRETNKEREIYPHRGRPRNGARGPSPPTRSTPSSLHARRPPPFDLALLDNSPRPASILVHSMHEMQQWLSPLSLLFLLETLLFLNPSAW